jgi:hypothetical protein
MVREKSFPVLYLLSKLKEVANDPASWDKHRASDRFLLHLFVFSVLVFG